MLHRQACVAIESAVTLCITAQAAYSAWSIVTISLTSSSTWVYVGMLPSHSRGDVKDENMMVLLSKVHCDLATCRYTIAADLRLIVAYKAVACKLPVRYIILQDGLP